MAFLTETRLREIGFGGLGTGVLISEKASLYNPSRIFIGNNVRIDDFSILSAGEGGIYLGDHVHIACYVSLIGAGKIDVGAFSGLSARTAVYSSNDDYSGHALTGPTVPEKYRKVTVAPVNIGRHVIVGAGSVILPGTCMEDGVALGALSLANKTLEANFIYTGVPAKKLKPRHTAYLDLETRLLNER